MTNTASITSEDEEDYSVIVGVAKENYLGCNEEIKVSKNHCSVLYKTNCFSKNGLKFVFVIVIILFESLNITEMLDYDRMDR